MYITLPQPCWSLTGATEWIMSLCHHTESPGWTLGMAETAPSRIECHLWLAGKVRFGCTEHMSSSATSDSSGRSIRYAMALVIGTVCRTPWSLRISLSAVQPWKVRNAEHMVEPGYWAASVR